MSWETTLFVKTCFTKTNCTKRNKASIKIKKRIKDKTGTIIQIQLKLTFNFSP